MIAALDIIILSRLYASCLLCSKICCPPHNLLPRTVMVLHLLLIVRCTSLTLHLLVSFLSAMDPIPLFTVMSCSCPMTLIRHVDHVWFDHTDRVHNSGAGQGLIYFFLLSLSLFTLIPITTYYLVSSTNTRMYVTAVLLYINHCR